MYSYYLRTSDVRRGTREWHDAAQEDLRFLTTELNAAGSTQVSTRRDLASAIEQMIVDIETGTPTSMRNDDYARILKEAKISINRIPTSIVRDRLVLQ